MARAYRPRAASIFASAASAWGYFGSSMSARSAWEPAAIEINIGEQDSGIGAVLRNGAAGFNRLLHRHDCALDVAIELAQVGDPSVRAEVRTKVDHLLEGLQGIRIAAKLDLGIADDAEWSRSRGVQRIGLDAPCEAGGELVASQGEQAPRGGRLGVRGIMGERTFE